MVLERRSGRRRSPAAARSHPSARAILTAQDIRRPLRLISAAELFDVPVIAFNELNPAVPLDVVGQLDRAPDLVADWVETVMADVPEPARGSVLPERWLYEDEAEVERYVAVWVVEVQAETTLAALLPLTTPASAATLLR